MRRSVVVQQHPHRRRRMLVQAALLVLVALSVGALLGRYGSLGLYESLLAENQSLTEQVVRLEKGIAELRQKIENRETRENVNTSTLSLVRRELAEQQTLISDLEQGVRFYRSLMAPGDQPLGLSVSSIDLVPGSNQDRFQFRILVQQNARKHGLLSGTLRIDVIGSELGEPKTYELADLSAELPSTDIKLRFKYFQAIDGELSLPEGFTPRKMIAFAKASKPKQVEVRKDFPWAVQEKITHVGN
jgi:hypothetical protein